jgi:hypothetical protein
LIKNCFRGKENRPCLVNENKAQLYPQFLPYNGLLIASDKVLGKAFSVATDG